jgi:hypothetical protein
MEGEKSALMLGLACFHKQHHIFLFITKFNPLSRIVAQCILLYYFALSNARFYSVKRQMILLVNGRVLAMR